MLTVESMKEKIKIAIIDYNMSNIFSIKNAIDLLGFESLVTSDKKEILMADGAILPGVGSFPEAMKHLYDRKLINPIESFISSGKPFLGICLGFQLMFEESNEFENTMGLGIFNGKVKNFQDISSEIKVPHVGWNFVSKNNTQSNYKDPLPKLKNKEHFYFVHSCYVDPTEEDIVYTTTEYSGNRFTSSVISNNIFGFQFHPEKSGPEGIGLLNEIFKK